MKSRKHFSVHLCCWSLWTGKVPPSPGEASEVSAPLWKHRPYCPQLWQLSLFSCLATRVFYFLILASMLTLDCPKAVLLAHVPLRLCHLLWSRKCGVPENAPVAAVLSHSASCGFHYLHEDVFWARNSLNISVLQLRTRVYGMPGMIPGAGTPLCRHLMYHSAQGYGQLEARNLGAIPDLPGLTSCF